MTDLKLAQYIYPASFAEIKHGMALTQKLAISRAKKIRKYHNKYGIKKPIERCRPIYLRQLYAYIKLGRDAYLKRYSFGYKKFQSKAHSKDLQFRVFKCKVLKGKNPNKTELYKLKRLVYSGAKIWHLRDTHHSMTVDQIITSIRSRNA